MIKTILDSSSAIWPSEAYPNNNRQIFALTYAILIPASWLGSYFALRRYLQTDSTEMVFIHEKDEKLRLRARIRAIPILGPFMNSILDSSVGTQPDFATANEKKVGNN